MRTRSITVVLATVAALVLGTGLMSTAPVASAATPVQVVTVSAPSSSSTYATVEAWQLQGDGRYLRVARFLSARIGSQGMGPTSESLSRTPTGQYQLSQPFGLKPNPGNTGVPYFRVDKLDVWTGSNGAVINEHRRCAPGTCPASYGTGERLSNYPGSYDYAFFIGYNANPPYGTGAAPGRGSAFFFHVKNTQATGGCVAVAASQMTWLIRWLRFQNAPIVSIGVGSAAYAPIPNRYT